jgi:hypothetical protein
MPREIPAPPWSQLPKVEEMSEEQVASQGQVPDLYPYLIDAFGKRFGGHWLSMSADTMVYNIGLTDPADADLKLAEELRDKQVPAMRLPIQIVPVPLSEEDLQELYSQFTNQQLKGDVPADLAVETRVDLGRLVIGISQTAADAKQIEDEILAEMGSIDPSYPDYIIFYIDDSEGGMFLDRGHIPPYRAGKFAFMPQSPALTTQTARPTLFGRTMILGPRSFEEERLATAAMTVIQSRTRTSQHQRLGDTSGHQACSGIGC